MSYLNAERLYEYIREHTTPESIREARRRVLENPNGRVIVVPREKIADYFREKHYRKSQSRS